MARRTHGLSKSAEYRTWKAMQDRCYNPNNPQFGLWGGRGIKVSQRWRDSFRAFYEDMGPRPSSNHSIERMDNNGHYEPGNCKWATALEQSENRRVSLRIRMGDRLLTRAEYAAAEGIAVSTVYARIYRRGLLGPIVDADAIKVRRCC